jgi:hypothetical protein
VAAASACGATIPDGERQLQNDVFKRYWGKKFVWKFDDLPQQGSVAPERVPYSGYIYPDTAGGTLHALQKYDRAFHPGRFPASAHERWDTTAYRKTLYRTVTRRARLFGGRVQSRVAYTGTPHWHGHCNGWAAAAMRHAEPKNQVERNGVAFTPADIKALLAEIYIYNDTENLTGYEYAVNAGSFHAVLTNWIGRAFHPVGMEADPGEEKWNYPIYEYKTTTRRISPSQVEVQMNIGYAKNSRGEFQQSPRIKYTKHFSYRLNLNSEGEIVGGHFYRGSSMIDLLWIALQPTPGGSDTNKRGNPHVDVDEVLALWRESVPADERRTWLVVDPPKPDRLKNVRKLAAEERMVPLQNVRPRIADPAVVPAAAVEEEEDASVAAPPVDENYSPVFPVTEPAEAPWARPPASANPATVSLPYTRRGLFGLRRSR